MESESIGPIKRTVPQSKTKSQPWSLLLSLPPDIRNMIYYILCYHTENKGIIAPAPYNDDSGRTPNMESAIPLTLNGREHPVYLLYGDWLVEHMRTYLDNDAEAARQVQKIKQADGGVIHDFLLVQDSLLGVNNTVLSHSDNEGWTEHPISHVCARACLLQPTLSKVNRQLRSEVLSYFYGANTFRLVWGVYGAYPDIEKMSMKWLHAIGDHNLHLIERLEMLRYAKEGHERWVRIDGLSIESIAGRERWVVKCREPFLTPLPPPMGEKWICKGKGWIKVKGWYIAEAFRKNIEGSNGLSVRSLEMVLLGRRWVPPSVRPYLAMEEEFQAMEMSFMTRYRGRKARKVRMLAEGEVQVGIDDILASVDFLEMKVRANMARLGTAQVEEYDSWVPRILMWLSPVRVVAVIGDVVLGRLGRR